MNKLSRTREDAFDKRAYSSRIFASRLASIQKVRRSVKIRPRVADQLATSSWRPNHVHLSKSVKNSRFLAVFYYFSPNRFVRSEGEILSRFLFSSSLFRSVFFTRHEGEPDRADRIRLPKHFPGEARATGQDLCVSAMDLTFFN